MKKLFFTALVAVAAVGGAYAQDLWLDGNTGAANYTCAGGGAACHINYSVSSGTIVYQQAGTSGNQGASSTLGSYQFEN